MTNSRTILTGLLVAAVGLLAGCPKKCPKTHVSLTELVSRYNANAAPVRRLWARADIRILAARKPGGVPILTATSGLLLLNKGKDPARPPAFALIGRELGRDVFRLGHSSKEDVYYFWYRIGGDGRAYWGRRTLAGAPGADLLDIDPYQLLAVLGLWELPGSTSLPAVAMAIDRKPCRYVVTYIDRQPVTGRIGFKREMLFRWKKDVIPQRPYQINFFDADGRRLMTATLDDYQAIDLTESDTVAVMPTDITLESANWPGRKKLVHRIHLKLSRMTDDDIWDPDVLVFDGVDLPASIRKEQIDRGIPAAKKEDQ